VRNRPGNSSEPKFELDLIPWNRQRSRFLHLMPRRLRRFCVFQVLDTLDKTIKLVRVDQNSYALSAPTQEDRLMLKMGAINQRAELLLRFRYREHVCHSQILTQ
jgi:hypothetical protein